MKVLLAGCVIVDEYERILLLHRNTHNKYQWELPGGKVEDELPAEAAIRELYEELGIIVQLTAELGTADFEEGDNEYQYIWFQAVIIGGEPSVREPDTFDDVDYIEFDDLASLSLSANMEILFAHLVSGEVKLRTDGIDE
jgi:8-oxo-dGTP pyrophosphatase MutT (NUDIX family)